MFSPMIVGSDAFLDMPTSSRELYFQLGMYADDDGFVNPKRVIRMVGASDDDLKILSAKRFVIQFENGVLVIKHWRMNNLVRKDWYQPTQYLEEKKKLFIKKNGSYTDDNSQGVPVVNEFVNSSSTQVRLGKVRLGKDITTISSPIGDFEVFWSTYPKKVGKGAVLRWWNKNKPSLDLLQKMCDAIKKQVTTEQWLKDNGQFIPQPATWLNQQRWLDEVTSVGLEYKKY